MTPPLHILHLEDDVNDAELIAIELASQKQTWPHELLQVSSQGQFSQALEAGQFDVILTDNAGPSFNGRDSLILAQTKCPQAVFLCVSGALERNPAASLAGVDGFVLKDRLQELVPAIQRALQQKRNRKSSL